MKRCCLLFLFIVCLGIANAQEFYGGLLAGFNASQIEGDRSSGYNKPGLVGGAWVQRDFSQRLFGSMEIYYTQKGSRLLPTRKNDYYKFVYRLNYIELPVSVGFKLNNDFRFYTGLSYAYLFNNSGFDDYGRILVDDYGTSNWEMGILAGMKVNLTRLIDQYWAEKFKLDIRWQFSVFSIDQNHDFFLSNKGYLRESDYNNVISFVLYFQVGKLYN
jgi:hypothetical protein